jgi:muramoyltetrapeptide carboxypeptidase
MMKLWSNSRVDALFSLRGGYGCVQLLADLDYAYLASKPKPIIGYSDLTVLFLALAKKSYAQFASKRYQFFHAPMLCELSRLDEQALKSFTNLLEQIDPDLYREGLLILPADKAHPAHRVMGGNLSLVASLIGTDYEMTKDNQVIFLEDCKEEAYKIDRYLRQLNMAGYFDAIKELWLGAAHETSYNYPYLENLARQKSFVLRRDLAYGHKGKHSLVLN